MVVECCRIQLHSTRAALSVTYILYPDTVSVNNLFQNGIKASTENAAADSVTSIDNDPANVRTVLSISMPVLITTQSEPDPSALGKHQYYLRQGPKLN